MNRELDRQVAKDKIDKELILTQSEYEEIVQELINAGWELDPKTGTFSHSMPVRKPLSNTGMNFFKFFQKYILGLFFFSYLLLMWAIYTKS